MKRIAVIGIAGAGKTTLARQVGERLDLPVIHLDRYYWRPGWVAPEPEAWLELHQQMVAGEAWIIDGNYSSTLPARLDAANTVIYLDLPRVLALWRAIKRSIQFRNQARPDVADGCREKIDLAFYRWIWDYPRRSRPKTLALLEQCKAEGKQVIHLTSARQVRSFLEHMRHQRVGLVSNGD